jgi:predicted AlkP superfamily phosphohydrolase/phosphomutase
MKRRTFLIGLDGATFTTLDPLMQHGVMPFLRSFLDRGARAGLRTIIPALTPPAWTSLMTGKKPGEHGVFDFFRMDSPDSRHIRFFTSQDVQSDTIWSLASDAGLRVTSLNYPAMFPAPRIRGNVVPGWIPWKQMRLACWPEDLFERLQGIPDFNPRELAMDIALEERATEGCDRHEEYLPWIELHIRRERNWFHILKFLDANDPADLTAVLFDGVDKLQHLCWRFLHSEDDGPLQADWEFKVRDLCIEYFRRLDGIIEEICSLAGSDAAVVIASDHGFGPTRNVFNVNTWLEQQGYLKWADDSDGAAGGAILGVGKVARHTWLLDWDHTTAFAATPTSNGVYIVVDREGSGKGIPRGEYDAFLQRLAGELAAARHPETGEPIVLEVWTREQAFVGPHGETAPDITLTMPDGGLISILKTHSIVSRRPSVAGAHRPVGVFGAKGPQIRKGFDAHELSILDIAPLVLYSLELPVPEEIQGRMPEEIFDQDHVKQAPVKKKARKGAAPSSLTRPAAQMSKDDEQIVMERLRELGYID